MEALGARIDRLHGTTARGTTVFDLAYARLDPGLHAVGIHRAALHGTLWQAFAHSSAALEAGRAVAEVDWGGWRQGRTTRHRGSLAAARRGDLVIDASGARSALRWRS